MSLQEEAEHIEDLIADFNVAQVGLFDESQFLPEAIQEAGVDIGLLVKRPHQLRGGRAMFTLSGQAMRRFYRQHQGQSVKLLIQMHGDTGFDVDSHRRQRMPRPRGPRHTTFGPE